MTSSHRLFMRRWYGTVLISAVMITLIILALVRR